MQAGVVTVFYRKCKRWEGWAEFGGVASKLGVLAVQPRLDKDGQQ